MEKNHCNGDDCWNAFLEGDKEAFAHYYNLHADALYRYGTKLCTDENMVKDAIQDGFVELYLHRARYNLQPQSLRYYLILTLRHNLVRKLKKSRSTLDEKQYALHFEPEYNIEKNMIAHEEETELNRKISVMLSALPPKQKEVLYLRYNSSLEYTDIAQILNITIESARKQVFRALARLREIYGK